VLLAAAVSGALIPAAGQSFHALPLLTTAEQVRDLTPDEANRGYPVRLRAVVTYFDRFDPASEDFFVQDATAGIYVNGTEALRSSLAVGDLVEVDGVTEDPDFAPQIGHPRFHVLGRSPLPAPRDVGFDALISTREDSQWVRFEGVVRNVAVDGNSLTMELSGGGGRVGIHIADARGLDPSHLVDARVAAEGVCGADFNQNNQLTAVRLSLPDARQLRIMEPAPADPFRVTARSLGSLLAFTAAGATEHRVRVQGTVILRRPRGLFIQDGAQGLYIPGRADGPLASVGDRLDIVGFADPGDYTPVLTEARYRRLGSDALPGAVSVTGAQALTGAFDTLRVSMEATLRTLGYSDTDRTLMLQTGGVVFEARLEKGLSPRNWESTLPPGSKLRLTGVCSVDVDRNRMPNGFNLLLRGPEDVEVLSRPSWWTLERTLLLASLSLGLTLAVLAWVAVLRRRVRQQTEVIRRQLQSESELERRFRYVARATQDTIWDWNLVTQRVWWSEGIRTVFGYAPERVGEDAKWWYGRIHPEDAERVQQSLQKTVAVGGEQWSAEYRVRRADHTYADVLDRAYVMYDPSGSPCRVIGSSTDITAQKRAKEQLAHERNLLRTLIDTIPDYIYVKDRKGRLLVVNTALADLLGAASPDALLGKTDFDCYPEELASAFWADDRAVMKSGEAMINREETNVDSRGAVNWVLTTKVPLRDGQGDVMGLMGVGRIITSRKQAEKEMEKARDAAQAANRAKGEFLANMSHEIRTPLNGILGMTELALGTVLDAEQREYLEAVKSSGDSLLGVINDILDFSKIDAGKLELSPVEFDLRRHLQEIVKLMRVPAELKGLRLGCSIAPEIPLLIEGDPARLRQVVLNLFGNAVKFTEHGEVALEVFKEAENEDGLTLHFVVRDTGIGVARPKQSVIFEAFAQADGSTTRRFGGTGLGLTISSRLVQLMGGRIWVESEEARGSRFHFSARFRAVAIGRGQARRELSAAQPEPLGSGRSSVPQGRTRILLAEDNAVNRAFMIRLLERHGYAVVVAVNGHEVLEALAEQRFDLVLMDIQMPGMDGLEATAAIRELEKDSGEHIPVVALTAHALKGDRERCFNAGMDGYLSKPVDSAELFQLIDTFVREMANDESVASWTPEGERVPEEALAR
jgi:PAS domain S-box-containing protein